MIDISESYCWSRQYFLNISGACGGQERETKFVHQKELKYLDTHRIVIFYLFVEVVALFIPFLLWYGMDKQQALRRIGVDVTKMDTMSAKSAHICNFVIKYLNNQSSYVRMFLFFEVLNLVISVMCFGFLYFYWEITPIDVLHFILIGKCGRISSFVFPLQTGCTYEQNSIVPGLGPDYLETACFLNINEVYCYIISGLYAWLLILLVSGVVNVFIRLMQLMCRKFRAICLKQSAGPFSLNANIHSLVEILSFSDFFIFENLSKHVESELFNDFCQDILKDLCPSTPEIEG